MKSDHPPIAYPRSGPHSIKKINEKSKEIPQIMTKSDFAEISENSEEEEQDDSQILNQCGVCDKKLNNLLELNNHMKSEHSMGSQKIDIKPSQKIHIKNANVKKNVKCLECDEKFLQYQHLKQHFRTVHANLETFECRICQIVEISRKKLFEHINYVHMHETRRPIKLYKELPRQTKICEFCSKVFSSAKASLALGTIHILRNGLEGGEGVAEILYYYYFDL